jgi:hypothetical protein
MIMKAAISIASRNPQAVQIRFGSGIVPESFLDSVSRAAIAKFELCEATMMGFSDPLKTVGDDAKDLRADGRAYRSDDGDCCDPNETGNQGILDRRDARFILEKRRKDREHGGLLRGWAANAARASP